MLSGDPGQPQGMVCVANAGLRDGVWQRGRADPLKRQGSVAGRAYDQNHLIVDHELGSALGHQHDLEISLMTVPSGAFVWCHVGLDQVRDDTPGGGVIDAQVLVEKVVAQPFAARGACPA